MKVKELIEQLQKLDQDKNIWILYDLSCEQEPTFVEFEKEEYSFLTDCKIKDGDYVHEAW